MYIDYMQICHFEYVYLRICAFCMGGSWELVP